MGNVEKSLGQIGFEAYNFHAGGKTFDGRDIPPWPEVGDKVRENWEAAAKAIVAAFETNKEQ